MCVIFFRFDTSGTDRYRLICAANRDEFLARPTEPAHFWPDPHSQILAGTDLVHSTVLPHSDSTNFTSQTGSESQISNRGGAKTNGTWLGVTKNGRFAFITNVRAAEVSDTTLLSRGFLVSEFLTSKVSPQEYLSRLAKNADKYGGFNLVVGDLIEPQVWYFGNKSGEPPVALKSGSLYALSNATLTTGRDWHKVKFGSALFETVVESRDRLEKETLVNNLLDILRNKSSNPPAEATEMQKFLDPICIDERNGYGTRTHTVVLVDSLLQTQMVEIDRYILDTKIEYWNGRMAYIDLYVKNTGHKIEEKEQRRNFTFNDTEKYKQ